jgi:hypothetical protein
MRKRLAGIVATTMAALAFTFGLTVGAAPVFAAITSVFTNVHYDM